MKRKKKGERKRERKWTEKTFAAQLRHREL